ncbi:alpha/beta hydrolase [Bacillus sp. UMB0899]|uniref:alpha/beta fold hydrolase n=1 Tax=Metabacillus schmidteae TaxID=2730405 RepID=UPI000C81014F|nr:alpha/beta hydrolase [Metabacillus schmidteae]PMC39179.1 alpha/beta hydrolase [Bacillus sp. UMB0899]
MPTVELKNGKTIAYDDIGNGMPLLFIHPPGMGRHVFYYQRKLSHSMRVICPDLTGHGDSSRIEATNISLKYYGEELMLLLDKLGIDRAIVCGYSAGGMIAQYMSIHFQDRVSGLILFGGYPAVLDRLFQLEHKIGMKLVKHNRDFLSKMLARSHTKDKKVREVLVTHMRKAQVEVWSKYYFEVLQSNIIKELKNISAPVLIIDGSKSEFTNKYHPYYKKRIKQLRLVIINKTNHQVPTKRWKIANKEIELFYKKLKNKAGKTE